MTEALSGCARGRAGAFERQGAERPDDRVEVLATRGTELRRATTVIQSNGRLGVLTVGYSAAAVPEPAERQGSVGVEHNTKGPPTAPST